MPLLAYDFSNVNYLFFCVDNKSTTIIANTKKGFFQTIF